MIKTYLAQTMRLHFVRTLVFITIALFFFPAFGQSGPSVTIKAPANNASVSGKVKIDADVTDTGLNAVKTIQFWVNGSYATFPITKSGSVFSMDFDTATIPNGPRPITVVAFDSAGRSNNATVYMNVNNASSTPDTTPPTVTFTSPTATTVGGTITISANATDTGVNASGVLAVYFDVDGKRLSTLITKSGASIFNTTLDTKTLPDGNHTLGVIVYDTALNSKTASLNITVNNTPAPDTSAPAVSITSPLPNATVSGTINVNASASDNVGVVGVQFKVNGNNLGAEDTASPYSASLNTATLSEGTHSLIAVARDAAGNTKTSSPVSITVNNLDTTNPTVSIITPANNATVSGTITLSALTGDSGINASGVQSIQFKVDGVVFNRPITKIGAATFNTTFDTKTLTDGTHSFSTTVYDGAGNNASASVSVTVDNSDTVFPQLSFTAPTANSTVNGSITVSATATDNKGVLGVQFYIDNTPLGAEDTTAPYSVSLNTANLTNGAHTLTASTRDAAGNTTAKSITVTVNNAPSVLQATITNPAANAIIQGTITISATATSNVAIAHIQFKVDGNNLGSRDNRAPYSTSLDTTLLPDGTHTITAFVTDIAGRTVCVSHTPTINNQLSLDSGLVGYWRLDEISGIYALDFSGSGNNGTLAGNPQRIAGRFGQAVDINGNNSIIVDKSLSLANLPNFTVSTWIYPRQKPGTIISKGWLLNVLSDGKLQFYAFPAPNPSTSPFTIHVTVPAITLNQWQHVVVAVQGQAVQIYVNGILQSLFSNSSLGGISRLDDSGLDLIIGKDTGLQAPFNGAIDEVRMYNRRLAPHEVANLYALVPGPISDTTPPSVPTNLQLTNPLNPFATSVDFFWGGATDNITVVGYKVFRNGVEIATTVTPRFKDTGLSANTSYQYRVAAYDQAGNVSAQSAALIAVTAATNPSIASGLVGYWKFDETSGATAFDFSPAGNNGLLIANPARVAGRFGQALDFNGSNRVTVNKSSSLANIPNLTISAWIYPRQSPGTIISRSGVWHLTFLSDGKLRFFAFAEPNSSTSPFATSVTLPAIVLHQWQHVVITLAGQSVKIYLNGVLQPMFTNSALGGVARFDDSGLDLLIGQDNTTQPSFVGTMDEVRIYNRVLTPTEIIDLYSSRP